MRYIIKIFVILAIVVLGVHVTLYFINFNYLKSYLIDRAKTQYEIHISIRGDVQICMLPIPHVAVRDISIYSNGNKIIKSGIARLFYNPFALLRDEMSPPSSIEFIDSKCIYHDIQSFLIEHKQSNILDKISTISLLNTKFVMQNGEITLEEIEVEKNISNPNSQDSESDYYVQAKYLYNANIYQIDLSVEGLSKKGKIKDFLFSVKSDGAALNIRGAGQDLLNDFSFQGSITAEIENFHQFALISSGSSSKDNQSNTQLKVDSVIEVKSSLMKVNDIKLVTNNADNVQGSIVIDYTMQPMEVILDLKFDTLNLDAILGLSKSNLEIKKYDLIGLMNKLLGIDIDVNLLKYFATFVNVEAKTIKLYSDEVKDFMFSSDIVDGDLYINTLAFKTPGGGEFAVYGATSSNSIRKKFLGQIWIYVAKFEDFAKWLRLSTEELYLSNISNTVIQSDISVTQHRVKFTEIKARLGDLLVAGRASITKDGNKRVNITSNIRMNNFNLDELDFSKDFDNILMILYNADSDKTGMQYFDSVHDHNILRFLKFNFNGEITLDNLQFKGMNFSKTNLSIELAPNLLALHNIKTSSEFLALNNKIIFSLPAFRPYIEIYGTIPYIHTKILDQMIPASIIKHYSDENPNINLMSMHNFDGAINLQIDSLVGDINSASDIRLDLSLDNGATTMKSFNAKIYDGELSLVGNIISADTIPQYIFGFAFNNINPDHLMRKINGLTNLSGYMSLSGSISTSGQSLKALQNKMNGNLIIAGKNITWKGFGLDEIIKIPELETTLDDQMQRLNYYTQYGSTFFANMRGKIDITQGIASLNNIELDNKRIKGIFVARYDIANLLLNSVAKFSFIPIQENTAIILQVGSRGKIPNIENTFDTQKLVALLKNKSARRLASQKQLNKQNQLYNPILE